jgi:hypothetical protein
MTHSVPKAFAVFCCLIAMIGAAGSLSGAEKIVFKDVKAQSLQFIDWYQTIQLTPAQEAVKKAALEPLPAPCCSDNSAYTCCCKCNISRTVWGLSAYMIAKNNAGADEVRNKVKEWISFISPKGHSGRSCYNGGCARTFSNDGCGGMNADKVAL